MNQRSFYSSLYAALLFSILLHGVGCKGNRKPAAPIDPNTGKIKLKVWIVLGNPETVVGNRNNFGCRLKHAEVNAYITALKGLAKQMFGPRVKIAWPDGIGEKIVDTHLLAIPGGGNNQPGGLYRTRRHSPWVQTVPDAHWESGHLNIYFVGNVQDDNTSVTWAKALTFDPGHPEVVDGTIKPCIVVNDAGYEMISGIHPEQQPQTMVFWNILGHEMAHYLARFKGRSFDVGGGPTREYDDDTEHLEISLHPLNLLTVTLPHNPNIPGPHTKDGTEKKEIWDRIWAGNWNNNQ